MAAAIEQAVILVGGRGERLGALTRRTPKPLLPVGGRPFLEYWLDALAAAGVREIILCCGYLAEQFTAAYDGAKRGAAAVRCVTEPSPAGTGGAVALLAGDLRRRFFLLNGDSFTRPRWRALAAALGDDPRRRLGALTLAPPPDNSGRYGAVLSDADGTITGFAEKPPGEGAPMETGAPLETGAPSKAGAPAINAGVYAFLREAAELLRAPSSLERDLLPELARRRLLAGVAGGGGFIDIGVPEDYARAHRLVAGGG